LVTSSKPIALNIICMSKSCKYIFQLVLSSEIILYPLPTRQLAVNIHCYLKWNSWLHFVLQRHLYPITLVIVTNSNIWSLRQKYIYEFSLRYGL
jgi:hypothetical protein